MQLFHSCTFCDGQDLITDSPTRRIMSMTRHPLLVCDFIFSCFNLCYFPSVCPHCQHILITYQGKKEGRKDGKNREIRKLGRTDGRKDREVTVSGCSVVTVGTTVSRARMSVSLCVRVLRGHTLPITDSCVAWSESVFRSILRTPLAIHSQVSQKQRPAQLHETESHHKLISVACVLNSETNLKVRTTWHWLRKLIHDSPLRRLELYCQLESLLQKK